MIRVGTIHTHVVFVVIASVDNGARRAESRARNSSDRFTLARSTRDAQGK